MSAITISNLTHSYRSHLALRDVTLTIESGEFFGLFGPNGAGKTTLIRILSTLVIPSSGTARVCDLDVVRDADKVRSLIGLVFSNENSFLWATQRQAEFRIFRRAAESWMGTESPPRRRFTRPVRSRRGCRLCRAIVFHRDASATQCCPRLVA